MSNPPQFRHRRKPTKVVRHYYNGPTGTGDEEPEKDFTAVIIIALGALIAVFALLLYLK